MFILGLILGATVGIVCMSLCAIGKENDEINQQLPTYIVCKNGSSYLDDLKMANYKYTLETILTNDISFYQKLYDKNHNTYYLGRIDQSKFFLGIVKGESKNDRFKKL